MICPYNRAKTTTIVQENIDADGTKQTVYIENYELYKCPQEECGAWYSEKCSYNEG